MFVELNNDDSFIIMSECTRSQKMNDFLKKRLPQLQSPTHHQFESSNFTNVLFNKGRLWGTSVKLERVEFFFMKWDHCGEWEPEVQQKKKSLCIDEDHFAINISGRRKYKRELLWSASASFIVIFIRIYLAKWWVSEWF